MGDYAKKTILAVDDDITILTTIRSVLRDIYDVSLAKSSETAWTILANARVDLILLDVEMPGLSGMDFIKLLKKNRGWEDIPVIMVSSHGTKDVIVEATRIGARSFVVKPIVPKVLLEKIDAVLKADAGKISREELVKKLSLFAEACKLGNDARTEELAVELEKMRYNSETDAEIAEICRLSRRGDYEPAFKRTGKLLILYLYGGAKTAGK